MPASSDLLLKGNIKKLLFNQSVPAIAGMLVISLYNVADTIFIGYGVGSDALAGVALVLPIQMLISAISMAIGIGGSSIIARAIGAGDKAKANLCFGNMTTLAGISSLLSLILISFLAEEVVSIFKAEDKVAIQAVNYLRTLSYGFIPISLMVVFGNSIRSEGHAKTSMQAMILSSLINCGLDPLFIFVFDWGVQGAALATVSASVCTLLYLYFFIQTDRTNLHFATNIFSLNKSVVKELAAIGLSSFTRQSIGSLVIGMNNTLLLYYGSSVSVAAYGILTRIIMFGIMPILGINQGMMPIVGQNHGAHLHHRVLAGFKTAVIYASAFGLVFYALVMSIPELLLAIFTNDSQLIAKGSSITSTVLLAYPLIPLQILISGFFQALGNARMSFFFAVLRQIILLAPLVIIMSQLYGEYGIWYSFPIADSVGGVVALWIIRRHLKQQQNLLQGS